MKRKAYWVIRAACLLPVFASMTAVAACGQTSNASAPVEKTSTTSSAIAETLTLAQIEAYANAAGVPCGQVDKSGYHSLAVAGAIAQAESGGLCTFAVGPSCNGEDYRYAGLGLWQIDSCEHPDLTGTCSNISYATCAQGGGSASCSGGDWTNPQLNADWMVSITSSGANWSPWCTYDYPCSCSTCGGEYRSFISAAEAAYASVCGGSGSGSGSGGGGTCTYTCTANAANCPSSGACCSFGSWACDPATGCLVEDGCAPPPKPPTTPEYLSPAGNATISSPTTLTWYDDGTATSFNLLMYYTPVGGSMTYYYEWPGIVGTSFSFSPQVPGAYYEWFVQAVNSAGASAWSAEAQMYYPEACQYSCATYGCSANTCCPFGNYYCEGATGCLVYDGCSSCEYTCGAYGYYAGECVNGWYCNGSCIVYNGC